MSKYYMNIKLIIILSIFFASGNLYASYYLGRIKNEINFTSDMPEPYGTVKVFAKLTSNCEKLEYLKLVLHGKEINFPSKAYSDITRPDISSLELLYNPSDKTKLFLYLEYKDDLDDPEQFNIIRFVIIDDKLAERRIEEFSGEERSQSFMGCCPNE